MKKHLKAACLALLIAAAGAPMVHAHAHLTKAIPAANAIVPTAPTELDLTFGEDINLKFSGVTLTGPDNSAIVTGAATLMDADKTLVVPLINTLVPGTYTVDWHNLSRDGHKEKGTFQFTVRP